MRLLLGQTSPRVVDLPKESEDVALREHAVVARGFDRRGVGDVVETEEAEDRGEEGLRVRGVGVEIGGSRGGGGRGGSGGVGGGRGGRGGEGGGFGGGGRGGGRGEFAGGRNDDSGEVISLFGEDGDEVADGDTSSAVLYLLAGKQVRRRCGARGKKEVDGRGSCP